MKYTPMNPGKISIKNKDIYITILKKWYKKKKSWVTDTASNPVLIHVAV